MGVLNETDVVGDKDNVVTSQFEVPNNNNTGNNWGLNVFLIDISSSDDEDSSFDDDESDSDDLFVLFPPAVEFLSSPDFDEFDHSNLFDFVEDTETEGEEGGDGDDVEESAVVCFHPPVYIQRYCRVSETLRLLMESPKYKDVSADTGKTVMEVGCAEFGMMRYLKNMMEIGKLLFLDLDRDLMEEVFIQLGILKSHYLKPLPAEYLQKPERPQPLKVEAYSGCVTKVDRKLYQDNQNIFAIIGIEIIEHLHPETLRGFEQTTFGIYSPQIVIVTTPNSEFNEVFNLPPGKFRHWDHKFEWSRAEFKNWCEKIVGEFPEYTYRTEGICEGSPETHHLGCVSQMAVFEKKELSTGLGKSVPPELSFRVEENAYSIVQTVEFPNYVETRSTEQITRDEFQYYLNNFILPPKTLEDLVYDEVKVFKFPLARLQCLIGMPDAVKEDISILRSVVESEGHTVVEEDGELIAVFDIDALSAALQEQESTDEEDVDMNEDNNPTQVSYTYAEEEEESWE